MDPKHFIRFFGFQQWIFAQNTEGITHEESCRAPEGGGNSMNWILGHIAASRNDVLELIEEQPVWTPAEAAPYIRGSAGLHDANAARPIAEILGALDRSHATIKARLETIPAAAFDVPKEKGTVGDLFAFLQFHEAYHAGQIGLMRRLLGKEGVIR